MYSKKIPDVILSTKLVTISIIALVLIIMVSSSDCRDLHKRTFAGLGCLGVYDKAKFARLDRVCEECYQLYREPDLHSSCRILI
ncbi:unnamed protein product, partial [Medioppia subpectinata]